MSCVGYLGYSRVFVFGRCCLSLEYRDFRTIGGETNGRVQIDEDYSLPNAGPVPGVS